MPPGDPSRRAAGVDAPLDRTGRRQHGQVGRDLRPPVGHHDRDAADAHRGDEHEERDQRDADHHGCATLVAQPVGRAHGPGSCAATALARTW